MLAPWKARREALARQIAAHGESDSLRILAEGQASAVQIISEANEEARSTLMGENSLAVTQIDIGETIRQRLEFQEEKRQSNIISVLNEAAEELGDKEVQDHEPDHDWTARFFNEVQDVSSDEMRTIWAKILAGEVERPGSTSARTLTILKNLDRKPARLFNTLCSVCASIRLDVVMTESPSLLTSNKIMCASTVESDERETLCLVSDGHAGQILGPNVEVHHQFGRIRFAKSPEAAWLRCQAPSPQDGNAEFVNTLNRMMIEGSTELYAADRNAMDSTLRTAELHTEYQYHPTVDNRAEEQGLTTSKTATHYTTACRKGGPF